MQSVLAVRCMFLLVGWSLMATACEAIATNTYPAAHQCRPEHSGGGPTQGCVQAPHACGPRQAAAAGAAAGAGAAIGAAGADPAPVDPECR